HIPVGPCDGCTQAEGNVSTVSPIMTVLSIALCSKSATVASTQSSTAQQASLPRPFTPAIQAKSAPRCSVRPGGHQRVSSSAPRHRAVRQSAWLSAPVIVLIVVPRSFSTAPCGLSAVPGPQSPGGPCSPAAPAAGTAEAMVAIPRAHAPLARSAWVIIDYDPVRTSGTGHTREPEIMLPLVEGAIRRSHQVDHGDAGLAISAQVADIVCVQQHRVRRDQCFPLEQAPLRGRGIVQETAKLLLDLVAACTGAGRKLHVLGVDPPVVACRASTRAA